MAAAASAAVAMSSRPVSSPTRLSALSQKLLEGWTMLAQSCPDQSCNVPLVQARSGSPVLCVSCGMSWNRLADIAATDANGDADDGEGAEEYKEDEVKYDDIAQAFCAGEGAAGANANEIDAALPELTADEAAARDKARQRSDYISGQLASKLLQGWTLLNEHCPITNCQTPLVRNREKQRFCVGCGLWVRRADEDEAKGIPTPSQSARAPEPRREEEPTTTTASPARHVGEQQPAASNAGAEQLSSHTHRLRADASPSPLGKHPRENGMDLPLSVSTRQTDLGSVVAATVQTIGRKIEACRQLLEQTEDMHECQQVCSMIAQYVQTILTLQSLQER
eukprot:jgi/Chlat1/830/Chrsp104S01173